MRNSAVATSLGSTGVRVLFQVVRADVDEV